MYMYHVSLGWLASLLSMTVHDYCSFHYCSLTISKLECIPSNTHCTCTLCPQFSLALLLHHVTVQLSVSWSVPIHLTDPVILLQNCSHSFPHLISASRIHLHVSSSFINTLTKFNLYFTQLQNIDWKGKMPSKPFVPMLQ